MEDENSIYYRAFGGNHGKISSAVAGAGISNMVNLASHLLQFGLINQPDHQDVIAPMGKSPTMIANNLCSVVMSKLRSEKQYENLLKAFRSTDYDYPIQLLQKTLQEMTTTPQGLLIVICLHLPCMYD